MATFFRPTQERRKRDRSLLVITAFVLVLFFSDWVTGGSVRDTFRTVFAALSEGGVRVARTIGESGLFSGKASLARENAALQQQITDLQARAAAYDVLSLENGRLREFLRLASTTVGTTTEVISRRQGLPYSSFLINGGIEAGIVSGDLVLAPSGIVIGTVAESGAHYAVVRDLFSAGNTLDVSLKDTSTELEGRGNGNARAKVARASNVTVGDTVKGSQYRNRPVGNVGRVVVDQAGAYQEILVDQGVNFSTLQFVYVIPAK